MFLGRYRHNLDSKDRLTIPSRYRELLEGGAYVMQGFGRNLMVMTQEAYQIVSSQVNQMSITDPTARALRYLIFSAAERVALDRAGRILIPQSLRQTAGLENEVVLVGAGKYIEIWAPNLWAEMEAQLQNGELNAQRFAVLNLSLGS